MLNILIMGNNTQSQNITKTSKKNKKNREKRQMRRLEINNPKNLIITEHERENIYMKLNISLKNACIHGYLNLAKKLIDIGANVNFRYITYRDQYTYILNECCTLDHSNAEFVIYLIEHGANINAVDKDGNTPLNNACIYRKFDIIKILLENGAGANIGNNDKTTPLMQLCNYKYNAKKSNYSKQIIEEAIILVIKNTYDYNAKYTINCKNIIDLMNYYDNIYMMKLIAEYGCGFNYVDEYGTTILMNVCLITNDIDDIKYFLDRGADINAEKPNQKNSMHGGYSTPLICSIEHNCGTRTFKYLIENGAKFNKHVYKALCTHLNYGDFIPILNYISANNPAELSKVIHKTHKYLTCSDCNGSMDEEDINILIYEDLPPIIRNLQIFT